MDLTNKRGKRPLRPDIDHLILVKHVWQMLHCVFVLWRASLAEFCKLTNPLIITTCRNDVKKRFIVQRADLNESKWVTAFSIRRKGICSHSKLYNTVWLSQNGFINLREESIMFCFLILFVLGPVSQTRLSLNQDKALVKLRYLSSFYKNALEENITGVHIESEQWHGHILRYVRTRYFQLRPLSLGLALSLVCETGGWCFRLACVLFLCTAAHSYKCMNAVTRDFYLIIQVDYIFDLFLRKPSMPSENLKYRTH